MLFQKFFIDCRITQSLGSSRRARMQERIQTLINRLNRLLENSEIDRKTYNQMREVLEKKLQYLQSAKGFNTNSSSFQQEDLIQVEPSQHRIQPDFEEMGFELHDERPPRTVITYLKAKQTFRELLDQKKSLIDQGMHLKNKYQKQQISRAEFLRENSKLSQKLAKLSDLLETRRTILIEARPPIFELRDQLSFLQKKNDALEKSLSLSKIDNETYKTLNKEIRKKMEEIGRKIQLEVKKFPKWIDFFDNEIQYRKTRLDQAHPHDQGELIEREQQKIKELFTFIDSLRADVAMFSSAIAEVSTDVVQIENLEEVIDKLPTEISFTREKQKPKPDAEPEKKEILEYSGQSKMAWKCVGKYIQSSNIEKGPIGVCSRPLVSKNQLYLEIVKINEVQDSIMEEIYNIIKLSLALGNTISPIKQRTVVAEYIGRVVGVEKHRALDPIVVEKFFKNMKIPVPKELKRGGITTIGLVPFSATQDLEKECITIEEGAIKPLIPDVHLAFAEEKFISSECIGRVIRNTMGQVVGSIKDVQIHPDFGQIMILTSDIPRPELLNMILDHTNQTSSKDLTNEEKTWLVQFLVAKRLESYETEALKSENLTSFVLIEGFPILPNEIRSSYLSWVSVGFIRRSGAEFALIGTDLMLRPFPGELYDIEYKRVTTEDAETIGYAIGVDYIEDMLKISYATHFSEKLIPLIGNSSVQTEEEDIKTVFSTIKRKISDNLNVPLEKGLMPSSIFRYLLKEKLRSPKKRTVLKKNFENLKALFKIELIDLKDVEVKENEIVWKK